jgi:membrane-associated phospholipid phosphatase
MRWQKAHPDSILMIRQAESNHILKKQILIPTSIFVLLMIILFYFDTPIWLAARDMVSGEPYYSITDWITDYGLFLFYAVFGVIFILALVKKNKEHIRLIVVYAAAQLTFALVLVRALKIILGRARPEHGADFTFFSFSFRYNSFPSGHSADAFVSGVFLYYLLKHSRYPGCRYLPLIYAFLIAISRVFISSHYPSDVVAGMTIGILGAWFFISRLNAPLTGTARP